jgi:hypothetical protein
MESCIKNSIMDCSPCIRLVHKNLYVERKLVPEICIEIEIYSCLMPNMIKGLLGSYFLAWKSQQTACNFCKDSRFKEPYLVYPQKDRNGKRLQGKKAMGIKATVYSKTA